jgi:hypothetical protein
VRRLPKAIDRDRSSNVAPGSRLTLLARFPCRELEALKEENINQSDIAAARTAGQRRHRTARASKLEMWLRNGQT